MTAFKAFINAVEEKQEKEKRKLWRSYLTEADKQKQMVIALFQEHFPTLCSHVDLGDGESVWLCNNTEGRPKAGGDGYGEAGVLVEGLIFAAYRNSYCISFVVGIYEGEGVNLSQKVEILSDDPKKEQHLAAWIQSIQAEG